LSAVQESARWQRHIPSIVLGIVLALVAVAPLGKEATHPLVFGIYRALLLALVVLAGWANLRDPQEKRLCPYFLGLLAALGTLMVASVWFQVGSRFEGVYVFYKNALFGAGFIALAAYSSRRPTLWKRDLLIGACAITIIHLATALIFAGNSRPVFSTFTNPNYFASFMLPGLAVALAYGIYGDRRLRPAALAAAVFLAYGILNGTISRGATLAALLMLVLALFRLALDRFGRQRLALIAALSAAGLAVAAGGIYLVGRQVAPAVVAKFLDRGERDPYNYARPLIWGSSIRMIGEHPILGVGLGRYNYAAKRFTPAMEGALARYRKFPNIAHNEYLQYAVETGLPATALLLALAGYLAITAWKRAKNTDAESRPVQEAAILAMTGVGAHALVDNNWTVPVLASTLAVVGAGDLIPFRALASWRPRFEWTPARTALAAIALVAVIAQSIAIPALGLSFNEAGHRAYIAGNFARAESMHALAVGILPDHPVLLDNLGMVYLDEFTKSRKVEHRDHAITLFEASIAANPQFDIPAGHLETALIQGLTGNVETDRLIHERVVETDRHLLAVNPYNPFIRRNLAEALYNLGRREEAEQELSEAISMEPNYAPGYLRLAQWFAEKGQTTRSAEYTERALAIVNHYRDATIDPFEALLLGRPAPARP
jgi:O-antigen ligase